MKIDNNVMTFGRRGGSSDVLDVAGVSDAQLILVWYQICHVTLPRGALAWFPHYSPDGYKRSNRIKADLSGLLCPRTIRAPPWEQMINKHTVFSPLTFFLTF